MQYLLMIYANEAAQAKMTEAEQGQQIAEYQAFTKGITESGHIRGGEALQPSTTATVVRVVNGKSQRKDGPFAEAREQLGGFYVIEAKDLDEACAIAARIPDARGGAIEVRPIMQFS